jgi:hypothetical protein
MRFVKRSTVRLLDITCIRPVDPYGRLREYIYYIYIYIYILRSCSLRCAHPLDPVPIPSPFLSSIPSPSIPLPSSLEISGRASPFRSIFFSPNKCRSTPCPSAVHVGYCIRRVTAARNNFAQRSSYVNLHSSINTPKFFDQAIGHELNTYRLSQVEHRLSQALVSLLALRIISVSPSWNLRIWALSYVTPGRPNIL